MTAQTSHRGLADLTDVGLFERLATAVLREAHPLCSGLTHPGTNAEGMTVKAPIDNVSFVYGAAPPHLVAVQHTITAADSLEKKWLFDPNAPRARKSKKGAKARQRPSNRSKAPPGDLVKTARIVAQERLRTPHLLATLILTTNEEPSERLVRNVTAAGRVQRIAVEIWSRSRIAHFLDVNPTGQWIRQSFLKIEAQRLSPELLQALSVESVRKPPPHERPSTWVDRSLDQTVASIRAPLTYLAADSGLGKTVACYRVLKAHVDAGGYGIRLPHSLFETATTLERAVAEALRQLQPNLADGQNPFGCCSPEKQLFIVVEDVNRSAQPHLLIEKLAAWALPSDGTEKPWRVVCPVWPRFLGLVAEQERKAIEPVTVYATKLSRDEARRAVIRQVELCDRVMSEVDADEIANALGHDPLLIGLHDYSKPPRPHQVIGEFVEHALRRAEGPSTVLAADMHQALMALARSMLERRRLEPRWPELQEWQLAPACIEALRAVLTNAEIVRLGGVSDQHRLLFRHDRVLGWLLIESATGLDAKASLPDEIVNDPFYADILGAVLIRECQGTLLGRLQRNNPLALFHGLRLVGSQSPAIRERVYQAIVAWLQEPSTRAEANTYLRWQAIVALESTEGADVPALVRLIPDTHSYRFVAALHNGDVDAAIMACARYEFGSTYPFLDRQIEHVRLHFAKAFNNGVVERLVRGAKHHDRHRGLIELCGHLGEAALVGPLEALWLRDADRNSHLRSYLWAFARCCVEQSSAQRCLAPICDAWAALPDSAESDKRPSQRDDFAAESLERAFTRHPPSEASLSYLVSRAADADLRRPITYMIIGIDHPVALEWVVAYTAGQIRDEKPRIHIAFDFVDMWRRRRRSGPVSEVSRECLRNIWTRRSADAACRRAAFAFWSASNSSGDVSLLRQFRGDEVLGDALLAQRLARGDTEAVPELLPRLRDETQQHWWSWAHHVLTPQVIEELERALLARRERSQRAWLESLEGDRDLVNLLLRMSTADAERRLLAHWDHLRYSKRFVQLALFLGTDELKSLAHRSIMESPDPSRMLEHVSSTFGVHWAGHPGVTHEEQILQLEPYLDLLTEHDRGDLAQACNENGWFKTRRRFFDEHINQQSIAWKPEAAAKQFDEMIARDRGHHWIDHEIDMALKTGASLADFLGALRGWFVDRRSFAALQLLSTALISHGTRDDLSMLHVYEGMPAEAANALIVNTVFAIQRRSLK